MSPQVIIKNTMKNNIKSNENVVLLLGFNVVLEMYFINQFVAI
jgi:hypothetical protein